MGVLFCRDLLDYGQGARVLVELTPASDEDRKLKRQPNLMEAVIVRGATPQQIREAEDDFRQVALQKLYEDANAKLSKLEDDYRKVASAVDRRVDEVLRQRNAELSQREAAVGEREKRIAVREASLQAEVDRRVSEEVGARLLKYKEHETDLVRRESRLCDEQHALADQREQVKVDTEALVKAKVEFAATGGERLLSLLGLPEAESADGPDAATELMQDTTPPNDVVSLMQGELSRKGFDVHDGLIRQFLLSTCVAASTGQFIVLTGPTGVGKTSMVNLMATVLGAGCGVMPVRPGWIDPTDLLGFFNPQQNQYQPTPFMDYLLQAQQFSQANRLYFLALDEMNLSRIENYAADFLSRLEKTRSGDRDAVLNLYAVEIQRRLKAEVHELRQTLDTNPGNLNRIAILTRALQQYPPRMQIPEGVILLGTVNIDETTYLLSPKFFDRTFVIQISHSPLPSMITGLKVDNTLPGLQRVWGLSLATAKGLTADPSNVSDQVERVWKDLTTWQMAYLDALGVRLGFRFPHTFRRYMSAAQNLGFKDLNEVASGFFQAKLLPWISFHRDDMAVGASRSERKQDVLNRWAGDKSVANYPGLLASIKRMLDGNPVVIQYLE
jgi:hypothetical protein